MKFLEVRKLVDSLTETDVREYFGLRLKEGITEKQVTYVLVNYFGIEHIWDLKQDQYYGFCEHLRKLTTQKLVVGNKYRTTDNAANICTLISIIGDDYCIYFPPEKNETYGSFEGGEVEEFFDNLEEVPS